MVRVLHAEQIEKLLPVRAFLLQGCCAEAGFDPMNFTATPEPGLIHIPEVFITGNGPVSQGFLLDCFQQLLLASGFHPGFH
jgi:hypothetical protein